MDSMSSFVKIMMWRVFGYFIAIFVYKYWWSSRLVLGDLLEVEVCFTCRRPETADSGADLASDHDEVRNRLFSLLCLRRTKAGMYTVESNS